ncbi:MerR family regulatory protein [Pelagimonas phthalicica]|uniref:MerR family regulatory protein n=1 Tax=Pelagimonas phthalicica TaxID=1037362 RepID=A0A238JBQ1_9RHOB|nr:MerR family transcriptional regulator [Pelagimonas phthalicica]TDS91084.1 MerR-like DNA binding protein [Pelagimonas phthalicica]SMX28131.1 MerR family regulatory protein [Pelagimonas phthalicica]
MAKSRDAFRTISEVAEWLETPAHVLRFWESKFTQIKPVKRAGGRRYYRPADMELLGGIKKLLHEDGMTIKGVQKVLRESGVRHVAALNTHNVDEDATGDTIEDAPFIEAEVPDSVVSFPGKTEAEPPADTPDMFAEPDAEDGSDEAVIEIIDEAEEIGAAEEVSEDEASDVVVSESEDVQLDASEPELETATEALDIVEEAAPEPEIDVADETTEEVEPVEEAEPVAEDSDSVDDEVLTEEEPAPEPEESLADDAGDGFEPATPVEEAPEPDEALQSEDAPEEAELAEEVTAEPVAEEPVDEVVAEPDNEPEIEVEDEATETASEGSVVLAEEAEPEEPSDKPALIVPPRPALLGLIARIDRLTPDQAAALSAHCETLRDIAARAQKS